jgi:hypothetical protein
MYEIIQKFKEDHHIHNIAGLMMLHTFKWPWCLEELTNYVDGIYLLLHYSPGVKIDWWKNNSKLKNYVEIRETDEWQVTGFCGRDGSRYQGEFRDKCLRMIDEVEPQLVFFPDEDESLPEPEYLVRDLARFLKSRKRQLAFRRCNFWDSMDTVRKDKWIQFSPHTKIFKWEPNITYLPYIGWNNVSSYGKKRMVAKSAYKHYAYLEKEERERRFYEQYDEKQDIYKGLFDEPVLVKYTNPLKVPRT